MLPGLLGFLIGPPSGLLRLHLALNGPFPHLHGQTIHTGLVRQREHKHSLPPLVTGIPEAPQQPTIGNQPADPDIKLTAQHQRGFLPLALVIDKVQLANIVCFTRFGIKRMNE